MKEREIIIKSVIAAGNTYWGVTTYQILKRLLHLIYNKVLLSAPFYRWRNGALEIKRPDQCHTTMELEEYEFRQSNIPSNIIISLNMQNQISRYLSWLYEISFCKILQQLLCY